MKYSLKTYLEYWNSDQEFIYTMRMDGFVWNDDNYKYMINLVQKVLDDYEEEMVTPKILVYFFAIEVPRIISIISNSDFFKKNISDLYSSQESYESLVLKRKDELLLMQQSFFNNIKII